MIGRLAFLFICALLSVIVKAEDAVSWWDGSTSWFDSSQDGNESRELQEVRPLPDDMEHYTRGNLYPMESLQCYSSLTEPRRRLICPAARFVMLNICNILFFVHFISIDYSLHL